MAETEGRSSETEAKEARDRYRKAVADAVGVLRSEEVNRSFASLTLEEVIDQQIEKLEGAGTELLPNRLVYVDRIKDELLAVIDGIKETDPALFRPRDTSENSEDVNTPRDEEDK